MKGVIMSEYEFSFWAQNLKNTEDDHAEANGKILNNSEKREELADKISQVTMKSRGETIKEENLSNTIYYVDPYFVLKVIWSQTDELGRKAPIICYGKIPSLEKQEFESIVNNLVKSFESFAIKIGRDFSSGEEKKLLKQMITKSFMNLKEGENKKKILKIKSKKNWILGIGFSGTLAAFIIIMPFIIAPLPLLAATVYCLLTNYKK
jgi:hypothetical protein